MRGKHSNHVHGSAHYRWNGGTIITKDGYRKIRVGKSHPLADSNGYAYEHALVVVSAIGGLPGVGEVIHHTNGDKTDNRLENLELLTRREHESAHGRLKLSDQQVVAMRNAFSMGCGLAELAAKYGIAVGYASKVVRGEKRKSSGGPIFPQDNRSRATDGQFVGKRHAGRLLDGREWDEMPR